MSAATATEHGSLSNAVNFPLHPRRTEARWQLAHRTLALGRRTLVMGVVNITLDSFSDGGRFVDTDRAIAHGLELLEEGADLLDLGAESTRPGAIAGDPETATVSAEEEQRRLLPVIAGLLRAQPDAILSVDTYKASTARAAIAAGAAIVNDVSGFTWDPAMAATCAEQRCGIVVMHTRGTPEQWRAQTQLSGPELIAMVREGLSASMQIALQQGIDPEAIVLDAGYGFGKRDEENYALLARQSELLALSRPLLAGLSRKSFLGRTVLQRLRHKHPDAELDRAALENASAAALVAAILQGASIVRVHNARRAAEAAAIADEILSHAPEDF